MKNKLLSIILAFIMVLTSSISAFSATDIDISRFGDVNNDEKITASDARLLLRTAAKLDAETEDIITYGDIDSNGKITAADARTVLRVAAKLDNIICIVNGHNYKFDTSIKATCLTEGYDIYKCTVCSAVEKWDITGLGEHNYETVSEERVTTDSFDGVKIVKKCKYCDNITTVYAPADKTPQTDEQWLSFFNDAVNKLKTEAPAMMKSKHTNITELSISNHIAATYIIMIMDKLLPDNINDMLIEKGDNASAQENISPYGESFVSALTPADIKSISGTTDADGNYIITITMNDESNPDKQSSYGKIFQFMPVDDFINVYAPNNGMTVEKNNVELRYDNCYATATITPDGKVISYETMINANVSILNARYMIINTDIDATFYTVTKYYNIKW